MGVWTVFLKDIRHINVDKAGYVIIVFISVQQGRTHTESRKRLSVGL